MMVNHYYPPGHVLSTSANINLVTEIQIRVKLKLMEGPHNKGRNEVKVSYKEPLKKEGQGRKR